MRSLFSKIFVCVWLSHILAAALVFGLLVAAETQRGETQRRGPTILPSETLVRHARAAAQLGQRHETPALTRYLDELERRDGLRAVLFDAKGHELSGRETPRGSAQLATRALRSGEVEFTAYRNGMTGARRAKAPNGEVFVLVAQMPRVSNASPNEIAGLNLGRRETFEIVRFIAIFVAANCVAYGLALYITAPTTKLRRATQQFAGGDLSTRVGAQMGRRRDELADLGRDFDVMAERIESLLMAERRLLGDISHELRSPLARLQVALDLAWQGADDETQGYLQRIERESGRLNALIGQLLTLSRLETSGVEARGVPVPIATLVEEIAADADFEAGGQNRSVRVAKSEECQTLGNADLLRSAIENVVRNAVRYTNENTEVEISVHRAQSTLKPSETNGEKAMEQAVISVRDHGPGVAEEVLTRLFDPFYRVADARDRQSGGVGLGLSITARAVRFHGGEVHAINAPGGGLLVEIRLPIADVP